MSSCRQANGMYDCLRLRQTSTCQSHLTLLHSTRTPHSHILSPSPTIHALHITHLVKLSYASAPVPPSTDSLARGDPSVARLLLLGLCASRLLADRFVGMWRPAGFVRGCSTTDICCSSVAKEHAVSQGFGM